MVNILIFFIILFFFGFVVAIIDLGHDLKTIHGLC